MDELILPCWILSAGTEADNTSCNSETPEKANNGYSVSSSSQYATKNDHSSCDDDRRFSSNIIAS